MISSWPCLVTRNVPHALFKVKWLCTTSRSGHTAPDRRDTTPDDTSKAVATYGKILSLPASNSLLVRGHSNFSVEELMLRAIRKLCTTSSDTWSSSSLRIVALDYE